MQRGVVKQPSAARVLMGEGMRQMRGRRPCIGEKGIVVIDGRHPLLLASASPRRRELLERAGVPVVVATLAIDEAVLEKEAPERYLERVVDDKLEAGWAQIGGSPVVLVADTIVVCADRILGKPRDEEEARCTIAELAGRDHRVMTRFAWRAIAGQRDAQTVETRVWFRALDEAQIARYVAAGEGRDKAGAYAIQGIGAMLVARIDGSYTNVVGLPLAEVIGSLQRAHLLGPCPIR